MAHPGQWVLSATTIIGHLGLLLICISTLCDAGFFSKWTKLNEPLNPVSKVKQSTPVRNLMKPFESYSISKAKALTLKNAELLQTNDGQECLMNAYIGRLTQINPASATDAEKEAQKPLQTFIVIKKCPETFKLNIPANIIDVTLSYYVITYAGELHILHKLLVTYDWINFECEHKYRRQKQEYRFLHWYKHSEEVHEPRSPHLVNQKATPRCVLCNKAISPRQNRLQCRRCMCDIHEDCASSTKDNGFSDCHPQIAQLPNIFGEELRVLAKAYHPDFPSVVADCTEAIISITIRENNSDKLMKKLHGIYRLSGDATTITSLISQYEKREHPDMAKVENLHTVAGVLKRFLNKLPDPPITHAVFSAILRDTEKWTADSLGKHLKKLPITHKLILHHILQHLYNCKELEKYSSMKASNLSAVVSPCLFGQFADHNIATKVVEIGTIMIEMYPEVHESSLTK